MQTGFDFLTVINPLSFLDEVPEEPEGFITGTRASVTCPAFVETELFNFSTGKHPVRLARIHWTENWGGSATARLRILAGESAVSLYDGPMLHDVVPTGAAKRIYVRCPANSLCRFLLFNDTDTGVNRPLNMIVTGWIDRRNGP